MLGFFSAFFLLFSGVGLADVEQDSGLRNPLGEVAHYKLDKNRKRTSRMVRDGKMIAKVTAHVPDHLPGPAYEVRLDYVLKILLSGRQEGSETENFLEEFFTPGYMERLRTEKEIHTPDYKIKHLGIEDARMKDGHVYRDCDRILIWDMNQEEGELIWESEFLTDLFRTYRPDRSDRLFTQEDDTEIRAHIYYGVPVLGAVKIDVSKTENGRKVKAGFDYKRP